MKLLSALPLIALALAACDSKPGRVEPGTLPDGGRTSVPEHATAVPHEPATSTPGTVTHSKVEPADAGADAGDAGDNGRMPPQGQGYPGTAPFHPQGGADTGKQR